MKKGFTLIEVLIVIGIVTVLSGVVFGSILASRTKARDNSRIADMKTIELALAMYYDVNREYPASTSGDYLVDLNILVTEKYLSSLPTDPQSGQPYKYKTMIVNKYCMGLDLDGGFQTDSPEVQSFCNDSTYYWGSR